MSQYTDLITSEHRLAAKFVAMVDAVTSAFSSAADTASAMSGAFDLDGAVGAQLDVLGQWVGISRYASVTITGVYFSFDTPGLGFDQGMIKGPYDPSEGLSKMDDGTYRAMIRAKIGANHWDGTLPSYQSIMAQVFAGTGTTCFAQDNQDMSMTVYFTGSDPGALLSGLIKSGAIPIKCAGVRITGYYKPSVTGGRLFGFDVSNTLIGGFDQGALAISL
ncbi:MAG: DUF2612 domain-containing protein [Burkholderiales bacterium]|nr:DUF2612 domain-containing protein [Burkholderiales bacterium]